MKWYEKTWVTILSLILFFPVGLYLMWRYKNWNKIVKGVITGFFALCVLMNIATGGSNSIATNTSTKEEVKQEKSVDNNTDADSSSNIKETQLEETITKDNKDEETKVGEEEKDTDVPIEYKSALKKAEVYSDTMGMSKAGIYDQLTSEYGEQFPAEAAQYAIDNMQADWKSNALKKALTYQNEMSMSKQAIYDQLISEYGEKFTAEEAQYAIDNLK